MVAGFVTRNFHQLKNIFDTCVADPLWKITLRYTHVPTVAMDFHQGFHLEITDVEGGKRTAKKITLLKREKRQTTKKTTCFRGRRKEQMERIVMRTLWENLTTKKTKRLRKGKKI